MEAFCKCNFTMQALNLTCIDKASATLRGSIDKDFLSYLELWVATKATVSAPGVTLTVDSTCTIQLQSFDDPLCQELSSSSLAPSYPYIIVTIPSAGALVLAIMGMICGVALRQKKKKQIIVA